VAPLPDGSVLVSDAAPVGPCRRYADGFTSIVDLEAGPDGSIFVVQMAGISRVQ
jgi:hypothetical protein